LEVIHFGSGLYSERGKAGNDEEATDPVSHNARVWCSKYFMVLMLLELHGIFGSRRCGWTRKERERRREGE